MKIYKMQRASVLILFIVIFTTSCIYEPTEKYNVDLTKPTEVPGINVDLDLVTDTLNFYWASNINLKINAGDRKVRTVRYYLDNMELFGYNTESIFYITLSFDKPGIHTFKMSIITNTGSGSLADILGAEGFQYDSREWVLVAKQLKTDFNLSFQLNGNGPLFSWKEYDGVDFKTYRINDLSTRNNYDNLTNTFQNTDFTGAQGYYEVFVVDNENNEHLWGRCFLNKSLPALRIGNINNHVALIWNKTPFVNNIAEYQVFQKDYITNWTKVATLSSNDTSYLVATSNDMFAPNLSFYLYCVPKKYVYIDNTSSFAPFLQGVVTAIPGPKFDYNVGADCSGFYFYNYSSALKKYILYKYTIATDQVKTICDYNFNYDISPNAKYMLITGDSIFSLYDLNSNLVVKSANIKKIANVSYILYPKISDNGICVFNFNNSVYVYDFINERLIASKPTIVDMQKISPNGKYITVEKLDSIKFYRINESSLTFQSGLRKSGGLYLSENFDFLPGQDDYIYMFVPPFMTVRSCQDLSVVRSMNIGEYFFNIDFCSNKIFAPRDGNNWNIFDFNTGNLLRTIKSGLGTGGKNYTLLTHNIIFYSEYKYFLGD